jgi:rRNA-processing protein FCF1
MKAGKHIIFYIIQLYTFINNLKLNTMITRFMIDEIDGILILLGKQADKAVLKAFEKLPKEEIKAYRDSLVEEYHVLHPTTHLLVV